MVKIYFPFLALIFFSCTSAQISQTLGDILETDSRPSTEEVIQGLKQALIKGTNTGTDEASKVDGFFRNPQIKIPFPPDVQKVEDRLRQIGLDDQVDRFVMTLNRGAEEAAKEAGPIFISAIRSMTIQDAWGILRGDEHAATDYLKRTTSDALYSRFKPVVKRNLDKVNATKYYGDLVNAYNKIPFVQKVNPDLDDYATNKAIDGLFLLISKEEENIRENPLARTSEILKKVFGYEGS